MNKRQKKRDRMIRQFTQLLNFSGWFAKRPFLTPISNFILRPVANTGDVHVVIA